MPAPDDLLIRVQSEWKGWRNAEVRLRDLQNVHWFQPVQAPQPLVHGYISCTSIVAGEMPRRFRSSRDALTRRPSWLVWGHQARRRSLATAD